MTVRWVSLVALAYATGLGLDGPAYAQPTTPLPTGTIEPNQSADPATNGQAPAISEIIITAQRRSERAQKVPVSVSVLDNQALATKSIKDLFQAATLVPGMIFSRAPDDGLALTFRGLGTAARPQAFEQSIALFSDGVFLGKTRLYSIGLFDLDRIEFIKGTQSTMLGKNASLGAISLIPRQPGDHFSVGGQAGVEVADGGYQLDEATNIPVSSATAVRVAAHYNDLGGWVHNDLNGHRGPEHQDLGLRAIARTRLGDSATLQASYQYSYNRQIGASMQLVGGVLPAFYGDNQLNDHLSQFTSITPSGNTIHRTRSHIGSLKGELDLGRSVLIAQSAYVAYRLHNLDDMDFSRDDSVNFDRAERYRQFTQELRLQSPTGGAVDYMAGLFYMGSHWDSLEQQLWRVPGFPPVPPPVPGQLFNGPFANHFVQNQHAYSAFASGTWHIDPRLRVAGGIRFTRETKHAVFGREALAPLTVWNTIANPPFDPTPLDHRSSFIDGNLSLQYDVAPHIMAYVSYGRGNKSGGYVETNTIATPPQFLVDGKVPPALVAAGAAIKDEHVNSYEAGIKSQLFDHRLLLNVAAFQTNVKNFQDTVFTGGTLGFITFNGPVRSRGIEVESVAQVTPRLRLDGGLTYADATGIIQPIDPATNNPEVDSSGNAVFRNYRRAQAPKVTFNADFNYEAPLSPMLDWRVGAGIRHRSSMFNQRQELFLSKPLTTLDLVAGVERPDGRWELDLVVRNATSAIAEDFASPSVDPRFAAFYGAYVASPNPLRTVMLTVHAKY